MSFFKDLLLIETQKTQDKEINYTISIINKYYNEWKKTKRRVNAVDLITTTANKISNIDASLVDHIHDAAKIKLATLMMRCMEIPLWKPLETKEKIYKKIFPILSKLENIVPNTGTDGTLRQCVMTRLSAAIASQSPPPKIFVVYEPVIPKRYIKYIWGDAETIDKIYTMESLPLPNEYASLVEILKINHEKARKKYLNSI